VAATDTRLRVLSPDLFETLLGSDPTLLAVILRHTSRYLLDSEQRLVADLRQTNRELEQSLDFLRRTKEELNTAELIALTDTLTRVYNRRCLERDTAGLQERTGNTRRGVAFVLVDLDRFKGINDSHGHHVGDLVLKHVADALKSAIRTHDLPFRVGGDEFAVLFNGITENEAMELARRIHASIGSLRIELPSGTLTVTVSVGGTMYHPGESWEEFYKRADRNLYRVKEKGRDSIAWDAPMEPASHSE
jgi:diguanylate cyclase (GGDEF)-like protein